MLEIRKFSTTRFKTQLSVNTDTSAKKGVVYSTTSIILAQLRLKSYIVVARIFFHSISNCFILKQMVLSKIQKYSFLDYNNSMVLMLKDGRNTVCLRDY